MNDHSAPQFPPDLPILTVIFAVFDRVILRALEENRKNTSPPKNWREDCYIVA
jgi:hypothetical protein